MLTFAASVAAYTVLFVLVMTVAERVRAPGALPAALTAHQVVARGAIRPVAAAVTAVEAALAVLLLVGLVANPGPVALAGAALLFAGYGGYGRYLTVTGRGGPCGCGGVEVPMDGWVTGRAFALSALAGFGAVAAGEVLPLSRLGPPVLMVLLAGATIGTLLWHLPAAMREPADHRLAGVVR